MIFFTFASPLLAKNDAKESIGLLKYISIVPFFSIVKASLLPINLSPCVIKVTSFL